MANVIIHLDDDSRGHFLLGEVEESAPLPRPGSERIIRVSLTVEEPQEYARPDETKCYVAVRIKTDSAAATPQEARDRAAVLAEHADALLADVRSMPGLTHHEKLLLLDEIQSELRKQAGD
jgi:hypothetical protein